MKKYFGLIFLLLLFSIIVSGLFAIASFNKKDAIMTTIFGSIFLSSIIVAIKLSFKDMDDKTKIYDETTKELIAFKDDVKKATSKDELRPLFLRLKEYQDKFKTSDPYFMYILDLCQGMMEGKLSILDHKG